MFCSRVCYERLLCLDDAIRNHCLKDFRCPGLQSSVYSGFVLFSPNRGTNLTLSCQWEVWQQTNTQQLSVGGVARDQHPAAVSGRCGNKPTLSCQWEVWQQTNTQQLSVGGVTTDSCHHLFLHFSFDAVRWQRWLGCVRIENQFVCL